VCLDTLRKTDFYFKKQSLQRLFHKRYKLFLHINFASNLRLALGACCHSAVARKERSGLRVDSQHRCHIRAARALAAMAWFGRCMGSFCDMWGIGIPQSAALLAGYAGYVLVLPVIQQPE